jgi:hypothetical protein
MTSLVEDLSDGVRLIQLMVRHSDSLLPTLTEIAYHRLGDHGYVISRNPEVSQQS